MCSEQNCESLIAHILPYASSVLSLIWHPNNIWRLIEIFNLLVVIILDCYVTSSWIEIRCTGPNVEIMRKERIQQVTINYKSQWQKKQKKRTLRKTFYKHSTQIVQESLYTYISLIRETLCCCVILLLSLCQLTDTILPTFLLMQRKLR